MDLFIGCTQSFWRRKTLSFSYHLLHQEAIFSIRRVQMCTHLVVKFTIPVKSRCRDPPTGESWLNPNASDKPQTHHPPRWPNRTFSLSQTRTTSSVTSAESRARQKNLMMTKNNSLRLRKTNLTQAKNTHSPRVKFRWKKWELKIHIWMFRLNATTFLGRMCNNRLMCPSCRLICRRSILNSKA